MEKGLNTGAFLYYDILQCKTRHKNTLLCKPFTRGVLVIAY